MSELEEPNDVSHDEGGTENDTDPFAPENAPGFSLILQLRTYDVLMALLTDANPEAAAKIYAAHEAGTIIGPLPYIDM